MAGYEFITDLPDNWPELASSELKAYMPILARQLERMRNSNTLQLFNEKLAREWAIETGIIERLYTIDRGTTQLLIEKGIEASLIEHGSTDRPAGLIVPILQVQQAALEGVFGFVKQERELSTSFIKELHAVLTRYQETTEGINTLRELVEVPLIRGEWKKWPNNPKRPNGEIYYYCSPEHVAAEMDRLIEMHKSHIAKGIPSEIEAAWLHHRFTQIHPFQDGNGRVVRALASLIFIKDGWFPLTINRDQRSKYIASLEAADSGKLLPLIELFTDNQRGIFRKAMSSTEYTVPETILHSSDPIRQIISAVGEQIKTMKTKEEEEKEKLEKMVELSSHIENITEKRFYDVATLLNEEFRPMNNIALVGKKENGTDELVKIQKYTEKSAQELEYFADINTYFAIHWLRIENLVKFGLRNTNIILSFHSVGREFVGVMGVIAFADIDYYNKPLSGSRGIDNPILVGNIFQFVYSEEKEEVINRFEIWLKEILLDGLNLWRQQL